MNRDLQRVLRKLEEGNDEEDFVISIGEGGLGAPTAKAELTDDDINEIVRRATPTKGQDYFTRGEILDIIDQVRSQVKDGKDGKDGKSGRDGKDGERGADGEAPDPEQVAITAINLLEHFEGDARLTARALRDLDEAVREILERGGFFEFSESQIKTIKDLMPKYPPINAGGSGATFLKSLRDVDLSGLSKNADGKYILGSGSGGGGGHTIQDEGTPLTQRTNLNFVGAGVAVTDDSGNDATVVTINGGGGGAVDSVNGQTGVVVLDADDIDDTSTTHKFATATQLGKVDNISITQAVDLDALESASHAALTVTDSSEIDFTLTGQDLTASLVAGSIDETKLDASVNASLDLADSALQAEVDTLATVTARGATTSTPITLSPSGNDVALTVNGSGSGEGVNITHSGSGVKLNIGDTGSGDLIRAGTTKFVVTDAGNVSISGLTASQYVGTDASKNLQSLSTATVKTDLGLTGTNSGDVTLAGTPDYITISGQTITRNKLDLVDDLNTFTSANLATMLTDETGSGANVFAVSPTLTGNPSVQPTSPITNAPYSIVSDEPTTNLVVNPKFEVNITDGWSDLGTVTRTRDTTEKYIGSASMKLVTTAVNSGAVTSSIAVDASSTYVFSAWVKGAVGGETLQFILTPNVSSASSSKHIAFSFAQVNDPVTTSWKRMRWWITTGASDSSMTCQIASINAASQTIYVDGVQLEKRANPTGITDTAHPPSAYCDGSLGNGHSWSGTADNSTSSRVAGVHFLAPINADSYSGFVQRTDGTIASAYFRADEGTFSNILDVDEPVFPFKFVGQMKTAIITSGSPAGILYVENTANGNSAYIKSGVTTSEGFVLDFSSLTSGVGMAVYAPADLTAMQAAGGVFFKFAGKAASADMYKWGVDYFQAGDLGFNFNKALRMYGGGNMTSTNTATRTGTVSITTANATCTGVGTTFLTDYQRGDNIQIEQTAGTWTTYTVASVTSNTVLTMTSNGTAIVSTKAHRSKTRQYSPATIQLEGSYGNHSGGDGDFIYSISPNGSNGQLHVLKSSAIESTTLPTENSGDALVTKRYGSTSAVAITASTAETTVISGYTTPALELYNGKLFRIKFFGTSDSTNATDTITWRVKIGGTTVLTSAARQVGTAALMNFSGEITILGTSTSAQRVFLNVLGQDSTTTTADNVYNEQATATGAADCRYADNAITVTAQYGGANGTMSLMHSSIEII